MSMAELLKERKNFDLIMERRPNVMRAINSEDLPWEELTMRFAWQALDLFKKIWRFVSDFGYIPHFGVVQQRARQV